MKRLLYNDLLHWKSKTNRKPLILNGARQVGKTWLLREFGRQEYPSVAYVNCERVEEIAPIFIDFDTQRMVRALSSYTSIDIVPNQTLIIIDEIQAYPRALTALKYFCEDAPEYHVAVAGSLLGISLHQGVSFPVGKVETLRLYPLNFEEFMMALGRDQLVKTLQQGDWSLINSLSSLYIELLRQYYYVGGMPGVVKEYVSGAGPQAVRQLQKQILDDYRRDFSKHPEAREVPRINQIWDSVPQQLSKENKKFQYSTLKKGGRATEFELALQWLIDAGLVYKVQRVSKPVMPLRFYEEPSVFKLFALDVGLLGAMMDVPASQVLMGDNAFKEYKGALTENYVLTQIVTSGFPIRYYATNDSKVEVDFVMQTDERILPIEAKAEENVKSKSLRTLIEQYPELKGIRFSMLPYVDQGWMENIPLFAVCFQPRRGDTSTSR